MEERTLLECLEDHQINITDLIQLLDQDIQRYADNITHASHYNFKGGAYGDEIESQRLLRKLAVANQLVQIIKSQVRSK